MAISLRDQLLQAGLGSKQQSKEAERHARQQERERQKLPKEKRAAAARGQSDALQAQSAKVARDQELSRQSTEKAEKKARQAQIAQLIEQNRLPKTETEDRYNFVDRNKIRAIPADRSVRERLGRGEIAIVRGNEGYELVSAETAARIRERDGSAVIVCGVAKGDDDDGVPDDLIW
jgi:uncharacterized protein YaiL (DUF2058 family)